MAEESRQSSSTAKEPFPAAPDVLVTTPTRTPTREDTFAVASPSLETAGHVRYAPRISTNVPAGAARLSPLTPTPGVTRSDTELSRIGVRRRNTRVNTFQTIKEFDEFETVRPGWAPGSEPGIDPQKADGGHAMTSQLHAECQITIVDFSQEDLTIHELDNKQMIDFISQPQPDWVKCRWINVNGLSWDVIQALGKYKNLHRLAIEDIMNTRNRTKVDWYQHHAFMVLTCQKLVRMVEADGSDDEGDDHDIRSVRSRSSAKNTAKKVKSWFTGNRQDHPTTARILENGKRPELGHHYPHQGYLREQTTGLSDVFNPNTLCTLQRYRASQNDARIEFMENHSALASRGLAIMAEQVALFITSDNTVIAFFEQSADDVEKPILARLGSPDTILRQSCDASMVGQAIFDAIIDMAIPITTCYADVVGDLELDVLTSPSLKHSKDLYIIISEINKMLTLVSPIASLINALRDHKTALSQIEALKELQNPLEGVLITPMTYTYLGDVLDHCVLINEGLGQVKESANHMIDLLFNTISAYQNESMKQLTIVTIIFLPLTFLTGYFGQNFQVFDDIYRPEGITFFWYLAAPVVFATILVLMRDKIYQWVVAFFQRRHIISARKRRQQRRDRAKRAQESRDRAMALEKQRTL